MASLTLTVNDAFVPRIVTAMRATFPDATAGLLDGPAIRACLMRFVKEIVVSYEAGNAGSTAVNTQTTQSTADVNANIT